VEARYAEYASGIRCWHVGLVNDDLDRFDREYVFPLQKLQARGTIEGRLLSHTAKRRGKCKVDRIDLVPLRTA